MHLKDKVGDGKCYGGPLNSLDCEFEGGDCISFNQAYPLCKGDNLTDVEDLVGNSKCETKFMTNNCNFDGGDCCPLDIIQSPKFGDGQCNGGKISTKQCGYDNGDCRAFVNAHDKCSLLLMEDWLNEDEELNTILGDGVCNGSIYSSLKECGYEFGDCGAGQIGKDLTFGEASADSYLDFDVATSSNGTVVAIGLPSASPEGFIQVYEYTELKRWTERGSKITLSRENGSSRYQGSKYSISMNGNGSRVAVGIPWSFQKRGQIKVFEFNPTNGEWSQVGGTILGETRGDKAGSRIAMDRSGSRLAIAAPEASNKFEKGGRINIYSYNGQSWTKLALGIFGSENEEQIGLHGLDLNAADGSRVIFSYSSSNSAFTRVYGFDESTKEWMQLGSDVSSRNTSSLAISPDGSRIVISVNSDSYETPGEVRAFEFLSDEFSSHRILTSSNVDGDWVPIGEPIYSSVTRAGDTFGQSIAMSDDGNLLAIGSTNYGCDNYGSGCSIGAVELFRYFLPPQQRENMAFQTSNDLSINGFVHLPLKNPKKLQSSLSPLKDQGGDFTKSVIQDGERGQKNRIFGYHISFTSNSDLLSISGYDVTNEVGIVKAYRLDELFYEKCAVKDPSLIGDGTCNAKGPYNTDECGYDGGDCVNSASPSSSPTLTPAPSAAPTTIHSSHPSWSHKPTGRTTNIPSIDGAGGSPPTGAFPSFGKFPISFVGAPGRISPTHGGNPISDQISDQPSDSMDQLSCRNASGDCSCPSSLSFDLMTDYYPGETSWTLHDTDGVLVESGPPLGEEYEPSKLYSFTWDLVPSMSYRLVVRDSFGDGLSSSGYIELSWRTSCGSVGGTGVVANFGSKLSEIISL
jgi:hypothetical protein